MKINHLEIKDCQRLKLFELTPDRNLIIVGGDNAQGKTSVLESIKMLLGGKRAQVPRPVREGAEQASIRMVTDTDLVVEKTIEKDGKERLKVTGPRDANGQTLLNQIYNKSTIDPLAFSLLEKKKQREVLLSLVGVDPAVLDREIKDKADERTNVNRELAKLDAQISATPRYRMLHLKKVSIAEVTQQLQLANQVILDIEAKKQQLQHLRYLKAEVKTPNRRASS